jgi:predicted metal-binding membrane protein
MTLTAVPSRAARPSAWRRLRWRHPELSLLTVAVAAWLAVVILHLTMPSHAGAQHCSMAPHGVGHHHGTMSVDVLADGCVGVSSGAMEFPDSIALWAVMAAAMMLPTTLPAARSIALNGRWNRRHRGQALFAVGYLAVWSAFGALALTAAWLIGPKAVGALAVSALLATAAAWELTRRKRFFLRACHRVRALPADGWRADRACVGEGLRNGLQCAGACGPMMLPMALAPHALWLMVVLFGVVVGEKWVTKGVDHLRLFAAVLAVVAVIVAFGAPLG